MASIFVDPVDAAARAQMNAFTGNLLKKYGIQKDLGRAEGEPEPE